MKQTIRRLSLGLCLSVTPPALAASAPVAPVVLTQGAPSTVPTEYRIDRADTLLIRVARHEEMGAEVSVLDDGKIVVPRVGELQVAGRTLKEVQELIASGLKKVLVNPEVSVAVKSPRLQLVYVSGIVRTPRGVPMQPGWRVSEAIAEAGGLLVKPERTRATLFRRPDQMIPLDLAAIYLKQDPNGNVPLQPGDNLDIQEEPTARIYVSGAVAKSGAVELPKGSGIAEAIALAGGVTPLAAPSRTVIQRADGKQIPVDMDAVLNQGKPAPEITLESGDQILVPENHHRVMVLGRVRSPGAFLLRDGATMTVAEAVSMAGGADPRARTSRIGVIRTVNGEATVIPVDLKGLLRKGKAEGILALQDQDIVFVPETDAPDWSKVIPGAQALGSLFYFVTR